MFKALVAESSQHGSDGLPPLYRIHKTFWFPRPAAYLQLQNPSITPQSLYEYQFFLWDPMALCGKIPCPNNGCKSPFWRHGHVRYPRRVVDIDCTLWLIGYRYRCPKCTNPNQVTFRSWDKRISASFGDFLGPDSPTLAPRRIADRSHAASYACHASQSLIGTSLTSRRLPVSIQRPLFIMRQL
ncbi:hypothetical protein HGRIS_001205 [Hohenbuehelia grisea]|uniref:DUF6729 domain-containing protein n=1 Tax=Hohenbuehelia grisea TaxID=104357 RepID=A0ABR3JNL1_9AGAR